MLTQWFVANQTHSDARELTYCEFPSKWRWEETSRTWERRCNNNSKIGRIHYVHPSAGDRYFLRMLLLVVRGATDYEELRSFQGIPLILLSRVHVGLVASLVMTRNGTMPLMRLLLGQHLGN
jgi:hypothetical protein